MRTLREATWRQPGLLRTALSCSKLARKMEFSFSEVWI